MSGNEGSTTAYCGRLTVFILLVLGSFLATALLVGITSQDLFLDLGVLFLIVEEFGVGLEDVCNTSGQQSRSVVLPGSS